MDIFDSNLASVVLTETLTPYRADGFAGVPYVLLSEPLTSG